MPVRPPRQGPAITASPGFNQASQDADRCGVRQHCAQCLTPVYANGRSTPAGEILCSPCHGALWGPRATDALRESVERHSDSRRPMRPSPLLSTPR